jgi:hypothetical protein
MLKNTASQTVAFQMVSATDGNAVTSGTPTVYVTGDGGTQGTGSGTSTHEGNGCWSYVPAQSETNYAHVAFTMALTGAVSQTVQAWPMTLADFKADVSTLESRLSSARAGYLDKLNVSGTIAHSDAAATYKADVSGVSTLTAQQVWEYVTRELTSAGSGGATAQEVWEYATRALTDKADFALSAAGVTAVQTGLATSAALATVDGVVADILVDTGTTLDALIKDVPTVAEFEARTLVAANYFDPAADTVAGSRLPTHAPPTRTCGAPTQRPWRQYAPRHGWPNWTPRICLLMWQDWLLLPVLPR